MPWLCSDRSRSYPGRPARTAVAVLTAPCMGNIQGDWAGVSKGHSRCMTPPKLPTVELDLVRFQQTIEH